MSVAEISDAEKGIQIFQLNERFQGRKYVYKVSCVHYKKTMSSYFLMTLMYFSKRGKFISVYSLSQEITLQF